MSGALRAELIPGFITAGRAVFTIENAETGNRFTYRVARSRDGEVLFVSVLTGPDNTADYAYLGFIVSSPYGVWDRFIHGGAKTRIGPTAPSSLAFAWLWARLQMGRGLPDRLRVWHEGRCGRCGRALTVPESVESGIGPECASKMSRAS